MKRLLFFIGFFSLYFTGFANINYIDITKISNDEKIIDAYNYVKFNQSYFEAWSINWEFDVPKEKIVNKLKDIYTTLSSVNHKNEEFYLLLGDVAHYLYNLDDSISNRLAIENYNNAIKADSSDYRGYWFLAFHYTLSDEPIEAINLFIESKKHISNDTPVDYWEEYATASYYSNMKFNALMAMEKSREILKNPGQFENQYGNYVKENILHFEKDKDYVNKDLWKLSNENDKRKIGFVSTPLGIKLVVDSAWHISIPDYKNHQSAIVINPDAIANIKGRPINYSIAILMKTADDKDRLEDYISKFTNNMNLKNKYNFSNKYENIITFEMEDPNAYQDIGGGRFMLIGIQRNYPKYPGVKLEEPSKFESSNNEQINYFSLVPEAERFTGKIFYVLLLDSCGDIYEKSVSVFKDFFDKNIILE